MIVLESGVELLTRDFGTDLKDVAIKRGGEESKGEETNEEDASYTEQEIVAELDSGDEEVVDTEAVKEEKKTRTLRSRRTIEKDGDREEQQAELRAKKFEEV